MAKDHKLIDVKNKIIKSIRKTFDEHPLAKFIFAAILIIGYFLFATKSYGIKDGLLISTLTWSFFVLCTPVADAGILFDLPMRLITGIRMIYSEVIVWVIAICLNIFMSINNPAIYDKTLLLSLFKHILDMPFPYWIIILLSAIGTFLSIYLADEVVDTDKVKGKYKNFLVKYRVLVFIFIIMLIILLYDFLLNKLRLGIPLI